MKADRLNRLRKKGPTPFCHSERSKESLFLFMELNRREILRFAQNDKINYLFRSLFSLSLACQSYKLRPHRALSVRGVRPCKDQTPQAEACATKNRSACK